MGISIVTDSGCDLSRPEVADAALDVVPMYVIFGNERFRDGVDIDRTQFYARLAKEQPTTEPPTQDDFRSAFRRHTAAGNHVVCITISSQISKSFENARAAAAEFPGLVHVVDSRGSSGMENLLALYATELSKRGKSAPEIAAAVDPKSLKCGAYFAVPDVTSLGRSGRLPKALVALGSMLNVSLILKMNESGAIGPAGQSRSFDKTLEIMVDAVVRAVDRAPRARIAISHVEAKDTAAQLAKMFSEKLGHPPEFLSINEATLTIATHMGKGAVGVFAIVPP